MVDVADLAGDVVADLATAADAANVTLDLSLADARVTGDRVLLRSLVENLVRNALNHNVAGGEAVIDVRTVGSEVGIRVENTGRHLSTIELAALTHPFVRIDGDHAAAPGLGIGTAVVQAVAAAHAGRFTVAGRPGGGLVAVVTLPIRAA